MVNIIEWCMIERPGSVESDIESGGETPIHLFVDNEISFAANEAGFEKVIAKLGDTRIWGSSIRLGDDCIRRTK